MVLEQVYYKNWLNRKFMELIISFGGRCWFNGCTSTENLQFAHTKATKLKGSGRGKKKRYYDIKNNRYCYALMCEEHHRQFDSDSEDEDNC